MSGRRLRILVFTQYFPPEVGATQTRLEVFARSLAEAGHDVTVVAEVPNHPLGIVFEGWRGARWRRSLEHGYEVVRVWVYTSARKSFLRRIAFYLTYAIDAFLAALLLVRRRPHVVFSSSPPLPVLFAAAAIAAVRRAPLVIDIRDIWPAVGLALGELRPGRAYRLARAVERLLYRRATLITCVTRGFVDHVVASGAAPEKVVFLPNGTVPEMFDPDRRDENLRAALGLGDRFVVGYVGLHGIAQGLPTLVEAAHRLADERVSFLFVGDGPVKSDLQRLAQDLGTDNVVFHDQVPLEEVAPYINVCDVLVVPLRALDILSTFIPSKMFDMMACGKPILLAVDGEARKILEDAGAGTYVEPENAAALADAVRRLAAEPPDVLEAMGARGRALVLADYDRHRHAADLEALLARVARP